MEEEKYLSVKQIVESEKYPFTKGQVDAWLFNRKINGLAKYVINIGRRIYIKESDFQKWIEEERD
jgi:hypothetical protein